LSCRLYFFFANNETIQKLQIDVQGRDMHTQPKYTAKLAQMSKVLTETLKTGTNNMQKIDEEQYNEAVDLLDIFKDCFQAEDLEAAKEYLLKYKTEGYNASPTNEVQRLLDLVTAEQKMLEQHQRHQNQLIELSRLEYALPQK
jgi:hypothetical protein